MIIRDGDWLLFDHDPKMGRTVWRRDNGDGTSTFRTDYAVDPTVDMNTAQRNLAQQGWSGDWHHVASVPMALAFGDGMGQALREKDDAYVSRWLNDSDNRAWRTKEGRV